MVRTILEARRSIAMLIAAVVGAWRLHAYALQVDNPFLGLIHLQTIVPNASWVIRPVSPGFTTLARFSNESLLS